MNNTQKNKLFKVSNRRYIGNKNKLMPWISKLIMENTKGDSFFDVFAGTGSVTDWELSYFNKFFINDFLYSNEIAFKAFFGNEKYDYKKLHNIANEYSKINNLKYDDTYFSDNYGNRFFSYNDSKKIGEIRERIDLNEELNDRERSILITSLIYSADRVANTVGHYDAYRKIKDIPDKFVFELIKPEQTNGKSINIFRQDANKLVHKINADVVFLDPPYNSRQYSRYYHVLEEIVKWDKPKLYGVAMKPKAENMSEYSKATAPNAFKDLVQHINGKYIVVTYNNTYENAKSSASRNKITHKEILDTLNSVGKTKIFDKKYKSFNAGNGYLDNHREFVFITEVNK